MKACIGWGEVVGARPMGSILSMAVMASAFALTGCGALTRTNYSRPSVDVPARWNGAEGLDRQDLTAHPALSSVKATQGNAWWRAFGDPSLDALIGRALAGNQDLAAAVVNLGRVNQEISLAGTNQLPSFSLSASRSASHTLRGPSYEARSDALSASASYEVDLWGSLASSTDAARWEANATEQDRRTVEISVAASVATLYWQLGYLSDQLEKSGQSIDYAEQTVVLAKERYRAGAISSVDELTAEQSLAAQQADRLTLLDQQSRANTALALLLGEPPGEDFRVSSERLRQPIPAVAAGIPADILAHRPDVEAAEMRVREALADSDAVRTSFYPNFSLTGSAGATSDALRDLLENPVGSIAASLTAPFLNVWTMRATVGIARSAYDSAVISFRKTFYQALVDVENALATRVHDDAQIAQLNVELAVTRKIEQRYAIQYAAGAVPLQDLLDAQQATRSADAQLAGIRYARLANQVALYVALGG